MTGVPAELDDLLQKIQSLTQADQLGPGEKRAKGSWRLPEEIPSRYPSHQGSGY